MNKAYLAGYLDGEACFYIYRSPGRPGIMCGITVTGVYKPLLEELKAHYGGGFYPASDRKLTTKQAWTWQVQGEKARDVAADVLPHLREKREQAEVLIKFWGWRETQPTRGVDWEPALPLIERIKQLKQVEYD